MTVTHHTEPTVAAVQLGTEGRPPDTYPIRTCATCPTQLSIYNPTAQCSVCTQKDVAIEIQWLGATNPNDPPDYTGSNLLRCRRCRAAFFARPKAGRHKRSVCYDCIPLRRVMS